MDFGHNTLRWFGASTCIAAPTGPPPSSVQHCCFQSAYAACPRIRGAQSSAQRIFYDFISLGFARRFEKFLFCQFMLTNKGFPLRSGGLSNLNFQGFEPSLHDAVFISEMLCFGLVKLRFQFHDKFIKLMQIDIGQERRNNPTKCTANINAQCFSSNVSVARRFRLRAAKE